jgi:hypothetical protein
MDLSTMDTHTTHTPGPWEQNQTYPCLVQNENGRTVAYTNIGNSVQDRYEEERRKTNKANARLIAAAPDMLAALEEAQIILSDPRAYRIPGSSDARISIGLAIRKAKGEA